MWLESKIYACLEGGEFMQIIKKYWFIFVLIILLIVAICFYVKTNKKEDVKNDYTDNKIVVGYAVDYFEKFVEIENVDEYNVTVKMLKVAQNNQLADYNMDELNKCEEDSFVKFTLKKGKNGYERFESALICQK